MITLKTWLRRNKGGEVEARELAESLVDDSRAPAVLDAPELCAAAKALIEALDKFDAELERVGYGQ